jgi:16S rRNA (cytosine1402-N4)-methyltransferase
MSSLHISVLMNEVIEGLDLQPEDVVIDGTINGGGHAFEISKKLSSKGILVGIDQDKYGLEVSKERLAKAQPDIHLVHDNTRHLDSILDSLNITSFNKLLLDLGWSSNQFENPERGFSFMHDGPLTMTLSDNPDTATFTAFDIINEWSEESLIDIIEGYGEERYAWKIVQSILEKRQEKPIERTLELAEIVSNAVPPKYRNGKVHPATKTFQALRITVNDEMGALREIMEKGFERLSPNGRMVIISFHSIEDRIVKHFFKNKKEEGHALIVTKKPIIASSQELLANRRSRSAKLRILQKI